jgi:hypothetical protein
MPVTARQSRPGAQRRIPSTDVVPSTERDSTPIASFDEPMPDRTGSEREYDEPRDERPTDPVVRSASPSASPSASLSIDAQDESGPTPDQIAQRAYELYQARGGQDGYDVEDWLAAERDLRSTRRQES